MSQTTPWKPGGPQFIEVARILEIPVDEARELVLDAWKTLVAREAERLSRNLRRAAK